MDAMKTILATLLLAFLAGTASGRAQVAYHDGKPVKRADIVLSDIADITADSESLRAELSRL